MQEYNNENLSILFIILLGFSIILLGFIISYINLYRFRSCYNKGFEGVICEKYKNY